MGNKSAMWKIIGASNHTGKERQEDDYYATDPIAIDKLLMVEMPNRSIWEPACGGSAVAYAWFVWQKGYTGKTEVSWI